MQVVRSVGSVQVIRVMVGAQLIQSVGGVWSLGSSMRIGSSLLIVWGLVSLLIVLGVMMSPAGVRALFWVPLSCMFWRVVVASLSGRVRFRPSVVMLLMVRLVRVVGWSWVCLMRGLWSVVVWVMLVLVRVSSWSVLMMGF